MPKHFVCNSCSCPRKRQCAAVRNTHIHWRVLSATADCRGEVLGPGRDPPPKQARPIGVVIRSFFCLCRFFRA
jgi:hypothetical protein